MALEPVQYNPFAAAAPGGAGGKLTPVEGNPFAGAETSVLQQFAGGFNERLGSSYIEGPERLVGMGIQALTGDDVNWYTAPAPISNWLKSSVAAPQTGAQRIARRVGEEFGQNAPIAAMGMAGAPAVAAARAGLGAEATLAQRSAGALAEGIANTPGMAAVGEGASIAGSGAGAGVAQELFPGNETAEMIGQLAGGVTPAVAGYGPVGIGARVVGAARERLSPSGQTLAAKRAVQEAVGPEIAGDEVQAALRDTERLKSEIPGYEPSLGEATGRQSLLASQRNIESQASGQNLDLLRGRREGNVKAVEDYRKAQTPAGSAPDAVVDTVRNRVEYLGDAIGGDMAAVGGQRRVLAERLPVVNAANEGAGLREALKGRREKAKLAMAAKAQAAGLNDVDISIPFKSFQDDIRKDVAGVGPLADRSNIPDAYRDVIDLDASKVNFNALMEFRSRITDDLQDATASANPSAKKVRMLEMIKHKVDGLIESGTQSADPGLAARYKQFRDEYKSEYVDRFNQGAAFKVRKRDGRGFYQTPDERVAEAFWKDVEGAKQFKRTYGEGAPETATLANVILDDLRVNAVRDGQINPGLFQTWMRRNNDVLNEFPQVRERIASVQSADEGLRLRGEELQRRQDKIGKSMLAKKVNAAVEGGNPQAIIDQAIQNPKLMRSLVSSTRNTDALPALRRAVFEKVSDGSPDQLESFLKNNDKALRIALKPGHLHSLQSILKAQRQINRLPPPQGKGIETNPLKDVEGALGTGVNQLMSRVFAAETGRTSWRYVGADLLGRFWRGHSRADAEKLMTKALYDPRVARDIADMMLLPKKRPETAKRLNTWLLGVDYYPDDENR